MKQFKLPVQFFGETVIPTLVSTDGSAKAVNAAWIRLQSFFKMNQPNTLTQSVTFEGTVNLDGDVFVDGIPLTVGGDMVRTTYDVDFNGIVDKAEELDDETNVVTAAEARTHLDDTDIHIGNSIPAIHTDIGSVGSGTATFDFAVGESFEITATGDFAIAVANVPAAKAWGMRIRCTDFGAHTIDISIINNTGFGDPIAFTAAGSDVLIIHSEGGSSEIFGNIMIEDAQ